jgi:hypothetical protein
MNPRNGLTLAAVIVLFSATALASSIGDPGGIIRKGINYTNFAVIHPDFTITFGETVLNNGFNPFDFNSTNSFCPTGTGTFDDTTVSGPDCRFINESDHTVNNVSQFFVATGSQLAPFMCVNQISGTCSKGPNGNALLFTGLGIPSEEYGAVTLADTTDPAFNILYFGFSNPGLAQIKHMSATPEPGSMELMLSGLFGIGVAMRRTALRGKSR